MGAQRMPMGNNCASHYLPAMQALLTRVTAHVPFYATYPKEISTMAAWQNLPFVRSEDLADHAHRFTAVRAGDIERRVQGQTSGTTGTPRTIAFTENDLVRTRDFFAAGMARIFGDNAVIVQMLPATSTSTLGMLLDEAFRCMGAETIDAAMFQSYEALNGLPNRITGILGMPRHVLAWGRYLRQTGQMKSPKSILLSADGMTAELRQHIADTWQCAVHVHYGLTEGCYGVAVSEQAGGPMVLRPADFFAEVIDARGHVVPAGHTGELVLTTLRQEGTPLLRYRTGDAATLVPHPAGQALALDILRLDAETQTRQRCWQEAMLQHPKALDAWCDDCELHLQLPPQARNQTQAEPLNHVIYSAACLSRMKVAKKIEREDTDD